MRISLIGLGLIGSSIARALNGKHDVVAYARSEYTRTRAVELGVVSACYAEIADAVRGADVVILCTPLTTYEGLMEAMLPHLAPEAIVTDVGSVKTIAVELGEKVIGDERFVGGHPIAGTENSGVDAGFAELFIGKKVILTPRKDTPQATVIRSLWEETGAQVEYMEHHVHDSIYAFVSHLAQFLCWAALGKKPYDGEDSLLKRFYRIGASDDKMWQDIFLYNHTPLSSALEFFLSELRDLKTADRTMLADVFTKAQRVRRHCAGADTLCLRNVTLTEEYLLPILVSMAYGKTIYDIEQQAHCTITEYTCTGFLDMTLFALCDVERCVDLVASSDCTSIIEQINSGIKRL